MDVNERLIRAVQTATHKLSSHGEFDTLLRDVLGICVEAVGAFGGTIYLHDAETRRLVFQHVLPTEVEPKLPMRDISDDFGMAGAAFQQRQTLTREIPERPSSELNPFEIATGIVVRSMVATPLQMEREDPIGVVQLINKTGGAFTENDARVLDTIASVATMAYLNFRLTEQSTRASTLLGMGKVSHDIGNLAASLHANLSFGEIALAQLSENARKKATRETIEAYLLDARPMMDDLKKSVDRIVGYSRLISDMSAGRELRPDFQPGYLSQVIETSAAYLESEARKKAIKLEYDIQPSERQTQYDDLYVIRIVQNLVGNAIKAVNESIDESLLVNQGKDSALGTVQIQYRDLGDFHQIKVVDSGPGMTKETARRILSGSARSRWNKAGGSGWGMKIVLELTNSHRGKVTIDSQLGKGSAFCVQFPTRLGENDSD